MATRATYTFQCNEKHKNYKHNFYIRYDGYPEGAVNYLKNAILKLYERNFKGLKNEQEALENVKTHINEVNEVIFKDSWSRLHNSFIQANDNCELMSEEDCKRMGDLDYRYTFIKKENQYFVTAERIVYGECAEDDRWEILHKDTPLAEFMRKYNN